MSAYSGPGCCPSPIRCPESCIQLFPKAQFPYQRNPMTMFASAAMMMASQFTSSSNARLPPWRDRLPERHEHSHSLRILVVGRPELVAEKPFLRTRAQDEGRIRHEERASQKHQVARREAGPEEVKREARVDRVPDQREWTAADELVPRVDLEEEVVVTPERDDGPEREADPRDREREPDRDERWRHFDARSGPERDDRVRHPEEIRRELGQTARGAQARAASGDRATACELREHDEHDPARDHDERDERVVHASASRSRIADR